MQYPGKKPSERKKPVLVQDTKEKEPQKSETDILRQEIKEGLKEIHRPASGLLLSGIAAGLELGVSVLVISVLMTLDKGNLQPVSKEILLALAYAVGFVLVILGHSELFTEHTALAVFPVLNGDASIPQLLRVWGLVFIANMIGSALIALAIAFVGPGLGIIEPQVFGELARKVTDHPWPVILASGVLAGWLMGLVSWLVTASRETVSQIAVIVLITATIGFTHLHHSIAGSIEVFTSMFTGQGATLGDFLYFLVWAVLGNIIGGVIVVALIKYGHILNAGKEPEEVKLRR